MLTFYCPACRESYRAGHRNAAKKVEEHMSAHEDKTREIITISPKGYLTERLRHERYWDERWSDA